MNVTRRIFVILLVIAIAQLLYYYPKLPDTIVSHYDTSGHPNGWMSKGGFFVLYGALLAVLSLIFYGLPSFIRRIPKSLVAMPRSEHWLAPGKIDGTMRELTRRTGIIGSATLIFLMTCFQLTAAANLSESGLLSATAFWITFFAYMVFVLIWVIEFVLRFR